MRRNRIRTIRWKRAARATWMRSARWSRGKNRRNSTERSYRGRLARPRARASQTSSRPKRNRLTRIQRPTTTLARSGSPGHRSTAENHDRKITRRRCGGNMRPCGSCTGGQITQVCNGCGGRGGFDYTCNSCNGRGCAACGGRGSTHTNCFTCNGRRTVNATCWHCHGSGQLSDY
jgi:hypothetical protein